MSSNSGYLAATPRSGWLTLMRLLDGSTVWERDLLGERVAYIWMPDDRVVTADPRLERVHVFDRSDGRLIKRFLFKQPDPRNLLVNLVRTGDLLCGPTSGGDSEGVAAMDMNSGEIVWRIKVDKPLVQLFSPQEGYLGLGLLGGDVRIVDAATGEPVIERRVAGAQAVLRGTLSDGTLVVQHRTVEAGIRATAIAALDVATDTELWRRDDVVPLWQLDRPLRVLDGKVPVLLPSRQPRKRGAKKGQKLRFAMIDIRTGLGTGAEAELSRDNRQLRLNGDFDVFPASGVAVIGTSSAIYALRTRSAPDQTPRDF